MSESATCAGCGRELEEPPDLPAEDRTPCPACGATGRVVSVTASSHGSATASARASLIRAWDSASLTLFGVLYAILVTVAGVVVAMVGTGGSWLWWAIYAGASLLVLALALLMLPQAVIAGMRWLVKRAKRGLPWPG